MAAVGRAEAAIGAAGAALVRLGDDRARRRERVVAEVVCAFFKNARGIVDEQRRQRKFTLARRLEDIAAGDLLALQVAGLAGDAKFVFGLIVIWFELGVTDRPVVDGAVLRDRGRAIALTRL